MKKTDLVRHLASQENTTPDEAADQLDDAVTQLLKKLRHGTAARLPGLGTISADKNWTFKPTSRPARKPR